ncbi:MAG: DNA-directed RNA polymerase subunit alpha C-terminal domain-containing protein [Desulfovibrionales bacterium]
MLKQKNEALRKKIDTERNLIKLIEKKENRNTKAASNAKIIQDYIGIPIKDMPLRDDARDNFVRFVRNKNFSVRAANVLLQNCCSLDDFTSLTEENLLSFPNCGRKTVREILTFLAENCSDGVPAPPLPLKEQLAAAPEESSIERLPLFSFKRLHEFAVEQLHPGFQGNLKNKDLALSVRALNILDELQLETIGEVMLTPGSELLKQPNFGEKCLRELQDVVRELCADEAKQHHLSLPPTEHSLAILPLFSSQRFRGVSVTDLHHGFHATTKLSELIISHRTSNALTRLGVLSIGEVMLTPGDELLRINGFGRKSLKEVRDTVRLLCFSNSQVEEQDAVNYSSYDAMVGCFVGQCLKNQRNQNLFKQRFCFTEGKAPTLEDLGQQFDITRERTRQILKKGLNKLRKKQNMDRLRSFWQQLDELVMKGGGLVKLGTLSTVLQAHYEWPTPPFSPALGQFLLLKEPDAILKQDDDLLTIPCPCEGCSLPRKRLQRFDFETTESFHIQVVAARLSDHCKAQCPEGKPVSTFYPAFIERLVENSDGLFMLYDDVVLPSKRWREKYCDKLEDVAGQVLENRGEPMHFREIAKSIRQANENFKDLSDRNTHASISRYDSIELINRGTYGLKSWGLGGYRSVSTAVEQFIDEKGLPQKRQDIITALQGEFSEQNITAALTVETRFTSIGEGFYDRPSNWHQRTCQGLIKLLPEPVADFANYLVSRNNNTSYKLVMAFIFIRSMDEDGSIYLYKLKDMFYNFYRSRHKKGLVVELDSSVMSHIDELAPADIKNKAIRRPLESFLHTDFFQDYSQNGAKLKLAAHLVAKLREDTTRNTLLITILKAIDDYFLKINPAGYPSIESPPLKVAEACQEFKQHDAEPEAEQHPPSITIKKKKRGKIKL